MSRRLLKNVRHILLTHALAANAHIAHGLPNVANESYNTKFKAKRKMKTKIETEQTTIQRKTHVKINAQCVFVVVAAVCLRFRLPFGTNRTTTKQRNENRTTKYRQSHTIERSLRLLGIKYLVLTFRFFRCSGIGCWVQFSVSCFSHKRECK